MQENSLLNQKINAAKYGVDFSFRCLDFMGPEGCKKLFRKNLKVFEDVVSQGQNITTKQANNVLHNNIMSSLCSLTLILDEALHDLFNKKRNDIGDEYKDDLHVVIYMLRCAFAHGPCKPCWKVVNKNYLRYIDLPVPCKLVQKFNDEFEKFHGKAPEEQVKNLVFDFPKLNGKEVATEHFGGLQGIICLSRMVQQLIIEDGESIGIPVPDPV